MDRKPGKRRLTWFGNNRPGASNIPDNSNTLGKMWQQEPGDGGQTDGWLVSEHQASDKTGPRRTGWEPLPNLPAWPPLPEEDPFAASKASDETYARLEGASYTDEHAAPTWGQQDSRLDPPRGGRLRALWWRFATTFRRPRLVLAAVAGVLVLVSIFGVAALGNAFLNRGANRAYGTPGVGNMNGAVVSPSAGQATATGGTATTTTATPVNTQPPVPLTIAFTCSSGVAGGTGQLCVHTLPNAALSLSVRYCDNSYAKGKAFHGGNYADNSGNYTWRWDVTTSCIGSATATVVAKASGQTVTQTWTFAITK